MYVGIDFGSCFSKISLLKGSVFLDIDNYNPEQGIPTQMMFYQGKMTCGVEAFERASANPDLVIKEFKSGARENLDSAIRVGGRIHTYKSMIKTFITDLFNKYILKKTGGKKGTDVFEAIAITVPNGRFNERTNASEYNEYLREIISEVSDLPMDRVFVCEEPIAAAISYFGYKNISNQSVVVFDLGGSTLDITTIDCTDSSYDVVWPEGNNVGSCSWNRSIKSHLIKRLGIESFESGYDEYCLDQQVEQCKKIMSVDDEHSLLFSGTSFPINRYNISIDEFNEWTLEETKASLLLMDKAIEGHCQNGGGSHNPIKTIILTGGGSNTRSVVDTIKDDYPDVTVIKHPLGSHAVSNGAAMYAAIESGKTVKKVISKVALHSYGYNKYDSNDKEYIETLIFKGEPFGSNKKIQKIGDKIRIDDYKAVFYIFESDVKQLDEGPNLVERRSSKYSITPIKFTFRLDEFKDEYGSIFYVHPLLTLDQNNIIKLTLFSEDDKIIAESTSHFEVSL